MDGRSFWSVVIAMSLFLSASGYVRPMAAGDCGSRQTPAARSSVVETANFRIYGVSRLPNAQAIGDDFETLRRSLCLTWRGEQQLPNWSPKCDVVVHATAGSYLRAVGQDQFATVGSSRVDTTGDKITLRRLDVLATQPGWFAAAVGHELTHVVMADEFCGGQLPAWADEGMAVLADTPAKQSLHLRDFNAGRQRGSTFRLASLVGECGYPSAERVPVFYGQSVSLVKYLVERGSPAEFVRFLHLLEKIGCDVALAEVYGLNGVAELERRWLQAVAEPTHLSDKLAIATAADAGAAASPFGSS